MQTGVSRAPEPQRRSSDSQSAFEKFSDGCHRYGWLISIAVYVLMFAYAQGEFNTALQDLKADVQQLKVEVFELSHLTRGLSK